MEINNIKKRKKIKLIVAISMLVILAVAYISVYISQYNKTMRIDIRKMDNSKPFVYAGISYELSAKGYSKEEFKSKYKDKLDKASDYFDIDNEYSQTKYFVVLTINMTRTGDKLYSELADVNKLKMSIKYYFLKNPSIYINEIIQGEQKSIEEMEEGETIVMESVYALDDIIFSKKAFDKILKQPVYIEFGQYEDVPYLSKIRVLDSIK